MGKSMQYFEWGHIEWIYEPAPGSSKNNMSIGITTILPNTKQNKHIHYGDEQFIYVLSGEGIQLIGSKVSEMKPRQIYHMEAGTIHETINNRDVPIKHLLISIPASYDQNIPLKENQSEIAWQGVEFDESIKLNEEIGYIYNTIVAPLNIAVTIFDGEGKVIIQGQDYPKTCREECLVDGRIRNCPMYSLKGEYDHPHYADTSAYICPYGLTVISIPVVIGGNVLGVIKGGHIRTTAEDSASKENIVPKGTVNAVLMQLRKLSDGIQNHYIFKNEELKLSRQENLYKATLKSAKEKMLNIQISNHFLFNTLNALAGMAVKEKAFGTYQSIIDMSGMLRYLSTNENCFVQIRDELQYINNYTNLQKLRCGDKLKIITDISPEIYTVNIPFNCLQPIVENCFVHGFKDTKGEMRIEMTGRLEGNKVVLEIKDNGEGMAEDTLEKLREKIRNYEKYNIRGMMMVYSKLKLFFEDDFEFAVDSKEGEGTAVKISYNI